MMSTMEPESNTKKAVVVASNVGELTQALSGTHEQRMHEEKTIVLKMTPGNRPEVVFTGFWTGKFIKAAMDSISRAYRLRRSRMHPTKLGQPKPEGKTLGVKEEVKANV